jgi:hypothetical protein
MAAGNALKILADVPISMLSRLIGIKLKFERRRYMHSTIQLVVAGILFLAPLYWGISFRKEDYLSIKSIWSVIFILAVIIFALHVDFSFKEAMFLNIVPGFVLGFILHPVWKFLRKWLYKPASFGIIIFLIIIAIVLLAIGTLSYEDTIAMFIK